MPRYYLIGLANTPPDQLTDQERDELNMMKTSIYEETIQQFRKLFLECFQDVQEEVEDFILALQHRDIPAINKTIQKVPELNPICDNSGLLDAEPTSWPNDGPWKATDQTSCC